MQDEETSVQELTSAPGAFAIGEGGNNPATIIVKIMGSTLMVLFEVISLNRGQSKSLKGNLELDFTAPAPLCCVVESSACAHRNAEKG